MEPRLSLIALGVADIARARHFYEVLGFRAGKASQESVTFLDTGGVVLALWSRSALAEDAGVPDSKPGFSGVALAHNTRSEADVDKALAEAVGAGAKLIKPTAKTFWGGYAGYFADPAATCGRWPTTPISRSTPKAASSSTCEPRPG